MTNEDLSRYCWLYLENIMTYEESRSMGIDGFRNYVENHVFPIPKSELVIGWKYPGYWVDKMSVVHATWNGKDFIYKKFQCGVAFNVTLSHFEDSDINTFIPIKEI